MSSRKRTPKSRRKVPDSTNEMSHTESDTSVQSNSSEIEVDQIEIIREHPTPAYGGVGSEVLSYSIFALYNFITYLEYILVISAEMRDQYVFSTASSCNKR